MKLWAVLFLLLPILGCVYVGWHLWQMLPLQNVWKTVIIVLMTACFCLLFANIVIGLDGIPLSLARILYKVGTSSPFILLYLVMLFLVLDLGKVVHLVSPSLMKDSWAGTLIVTGIMLVVFCYGNIRYERKVRVPIELKARTPLSQPLKVVMMSDLHLGYHNTRNDLSRWIGIINEENPDLVLMAGDIVDISINPLLEENMAEEFRRLKATVYTCLGNHDYYADEPKSEQFYRDANIKLLRDSSVLINNELVVIGRDDRTNTGRKSVAALANEAQKGKFTILLDHQPYHLDRTEQAGIDFQFSGHTHYGQVWPVSWIEDLIYEKAYGYHQRGDTRFYVTSGIGIWGGKFRIGTRSEYIVATIR